jgi:hypothetical protein
MNERIKELMKQSMVEYQFDMRFSPEKFAELIVRECLSIAHQEHKNALEFEWDNDDTAQTIRDSISEHFGVEDETKVG